MALKLSFLLLVLALIACTSAQVLITDCVELQNVKNNVLGNYALANNIDCSATASWNNGTGFEPLGNGTHGFTGVFNGSHYVILNLTINRPTADDVGLFGRVGPNAHILNTRLERVDIVGRYRTGSFIGTLTANGNVVEQCSAVLGTVSGLDSIGGLIGGSHNVATISESFADVIVSGNIRVGGLLGLNDGISGGVSEIRDSYALGDVSGAHSYVGGLVGDNNAGVIERCHATGKVMGGSNAYAGGLCGSSSGTVLQSYATGDVTSNGNYVGGLIGSISSLLVENCYARGNVAGANYVGGLIGLVNAGTVANCYSTGIPVVTGVGPGGLIGNKEPIGVVMSSYWDTDTSGVLGSAAGTPKTTAEMMMLSTYISWDFTNIWLRCKDYPVLVDLTQRPNIASSNPVTTCAALQAMCVDFDYHLTQHIDCSNTANWNSGAGFEPVGAERLPFSALFDGQNHTIHNLTINTVNTVYAGLFGHASASAEIINVVLEGVNITGYKHVGALIGKNEGRVTHCSSSGSLLSLPTAGTDIAGGLVGYNLEGAVENCHSSATVTGIDFVGGLLGWHDSGNLTNSYATGAVISLDSTDTVAGGLVAANFDFNTAPSSYISDCYATGEVIGVRRIGGLIGENAGGIIERCYATGAVKSTQNRVGGLVGYHNRGSITDAYATGSIDGVTDVGGLVGRNLASITNCYSTGAVSGSAGVGGLVGLHSGSASNSYWDIDTSGQATSAAGTGKSTAQMWWENTYMSWDLADTWWVGCNAYPQLSVVAPSPDLTQVISISDCEALQAMCLHLNYQLTQNINCSLTATWNSGAGFVPLGSSSTPFIGSFDGQGYEISSLTINRPGESYVGLFAAVAAEAIIEDFSLPDVMIAGNHYVGALAGHSEGTVSGMSVRGSISGAGDNVGGLLGYSGGSVSMSHTMGTVSGGNACGGLIGHQADPNMMDATVSTCFSRSDVSGAAGTGGLIGILGSGFMAVSYATGDVTSNSGEAGGLVGKSNGGVSDCYAKGAVHSSGSLPRVAGLVGLNEANGQVNTSYSTGAVTNFGDVTFWGGLVGDNAGTVSDSFWDTESSRRLTSNGGAGTLTLPMQTITTFSGASWDVQTGTLAATTWWMPSQDERSYPRLRALTTLIGNCNDLQAMGQDLNGHYALTADISCLASPPAFMPVGSLETPFMGTLAGNDYIISELILDDAPNSDYVGLFAYLDAAEITDVHLQVSQALGRDYVGMLAGFNANSRVSGSSFTGTIQGRDYVGGLLGFSGAEVIDCWSEGDPETHHITGRARVGGLIGQSEGVVQRSHAVHSIIATGQFVGGLIGAASGEVSQSFAQAKVTGVDHVGGVLGRVEASSQVTQICFRGAVFADNTAGGLIGEMLSPLSDTCALGRITVNNHTVGGLIGHATNQVVRSFAAVDIVMTDAPADAGGLMGVNQVALPLNSYWDREFSGLVVSDGGDPKTTNQMHQQTTFVSWSFGAIWQIDEGVDYPELIALDFPLLSYIESYSQSEAPQTQSAPRSQSQRQTDVPEPTPTGKPGPGSLLTTNEKIAIIVPSVVASLIGAAVGLYKCYYQRKEVQDKRRSQGHTELMAVS